jgi:asparagine synthase (glutamine-hydrolysing)
LGHVGCGICGFVGLSDKKLLQSMCEVQKHRGPDETSYFVDDGVGLGSDRLSIIDLKTGSQPVHNEDGSIWITFNGEIYNYVELKKELESKGHRFYTESDTETIVHAYEEWPNEFLSRLRGMFAFAIWDGRKRLLFLARDRFGKKPLYYSVIGKHIFFGSEMKAILCNEEFKRTINFDALDLYFTYSYIPSPLTIFEGVSKLPPAHYLVFQDGQVTVRQYWDINFAPREADESVLVERLYSSIEEAVKIRLRSDVPLGAFLSGGIDSSVVVSMMARLSRQAPKTFSVGFDSINELPYAKEVADSLGTDHHELFIEPKAFEVLPKLVWHLDEPFSDSSIIPTYYLSEATRREVKVALSGDGGDELFMGYPNMMDPSVYSLYMKVPGSVRKAGLNLVTRLPVDSNLKKMATHAQNKGYADQPPLMRYAMRTTVLDQEGLRRLYSGEMKAAHTPTDTYEFIRRIGEQTKSEDALDAIDYVAIKGPLSEGMLVKVDRMSSAASLEVRSPLMDHVLFEFVETIPSHLKINGRTTKYIFKKMAVAKGLVPSGIAHREKQGFGSPISDWFGGSWKETAEHLLDSSDATRRFFDGRQVSKLLSDPYTNAQALFSLIVFIIWHMTYMEENSGPPRIVPIKI